MAILSRKPPFASNKQYLVDFGFVCCVDPLDLINIQISSLTRCRSFHRDGKVFVKADKLTSDERSECYKGLRTVSVHLFGEVLEGLLVRCLETRPMVQTSLLSEVL